MLDQGVWISEAELETKKVLSYLAENTERANLVPMQRIEFRVSDELQREIWEKVPEEIRLPIEEDLAEGETPKPLYFMIPDEAALQSVLNTLSINVGSTSEPVPVTLSDHKFVITFLNAYEDIHGVDFRYFVGHDKFLYKIGTFLDESSGVVHMVINASPIASTVFTYNDLRAGQLIFEGVIGGFTKVASGIPRDSNYTRDLFTINTIYDNNHPFDEMRDRTWMMWPCIVDPIGNLPWYLNGQYYLDYRNQIPGMFHSFIPGLD